MSSDHYSTLGVSPSAESAEIRAAYRGLMRHCHPDANPDPEAHKRAQAITAAYSVLRDRAKRAKYDEERRDADIWRWIALPTPSVRAPAARTAGMAASVLAIVMVGAVFLFLPREQLVRQTTASEVKLGSTSPERPPPIELQPESDRLADLSEPPDIGSPPAPSPPKAVAEAGAEPLPAPASSVLPPRAGVAAQAPAKASRAQVIETSPRSMPPILETKALPATRAAAVEPKVAETPKRADTPPAPADAERVAALQRISSGFYDQSLQNADTAKKQLLLNVRVRETYQRASCRSDSCVADSYLRQIRDVGAIMESRALPPK